MLTTIPLARILRPLVYGVLGILLLLTGLLGTETGLRVSLAAASLWLPGKLSFQTLEGQLLESFTITELTYHEKKRGLSLHLKKARVDTGLWGLLQSPRQGPDLSIQALSWTRQGQTLYLTQLHLQSLFAQHSYTHIQVQLDTQGLIKQLPFSLQTTGNYALKTGRWQLVGNSLFAYGVQSLILTPKTNQGDWEVRWKKHSQDKPTAFTIRHRREPREQAEIFEIPGFPLRHLSPWLPKEVQYPPVANLTIIYRPPKTANASAKLEAQCHLPAGFFLVQQNPRTWLKVAYQDIRGQFRLSDWSWKASLHISDMHCHLPTQGIQLKNGFLNARMNDQAEFLADGHATIGKAELKVHSQDPLIWSLEGQNVIVYQTPMLWVQASPNLILDFTPPYFRLSGTLAIPQARVQLTAQRSPSIHSQDVIFIDEQTHPLSPINTHAYFQPNLAVTLNQVSYRGYGLEADLNGNLTITARQDGLLAAQGQLSIRQGKYRLQGKTRQIQQGKLLYPAGTLLSDPLLDIHLTELQTFSDTPSGKDLWVQGNLMRPQYQWQQNAGFAHPNLNINQTTTQPAAPSAFWLSDSANPLIEDIQHQLGLEEINVESRERSETLNTAAQKKDTVIVVGKYVSPKLYLQYLQSMLEDSSTVRLKYFLGSHWAIGVEAGTEGSGVDLGFSMDKD